MNSTKTKQTTDLEKRLRMIKTQLYGKNHLSTNFQTSSQPNATSALSETRYLRRDLLKIFFLATLAIITQISLYISLGKNLIKPPF